MKEKSSFDLFDFIDNNIMAITTVICIFIIVGVPLITIGRVVTTQQALNQECKTNYNLLQVALAGDNLSRLCQIKNQTVTIN